jgi:hypothetical protein
MVLYKIVEIPDVGTRVLWLTDVGTDGLHYGIYSPSGYAVAQDNTSIALESCTLLGDANDDDINAYRTWLLNQN